MTKADVIAHFGSTTKAAKALKIDSSTIRHWPSGVELSPRIAWRIEFATNGALKVGESK